MRDLIQAAAKVQTIFDALRLKYCFIGGIAVQKWGQVRVTDDIDLTIFTGFGNEETCVDKLLEHFAARVANIYETAVNGRMVLLKTKNGIELDISLGAFPFEENAISRAKKVLLANGNRLKVCTAEDLIIYKAFANRGIDWLDIEGVIVKQGKAKLDWGYIFGQLEPLAILKDEPEIVSKLRKTIDDISED